MGTLTIAMTISNSYVKLPEGKMAEDWLTKISKMDIIRATNHVMVTEVPKKSF